MTIEQIKKTGKIYVEWHTQDVMQQAERDDVVITEDEAIEVLHYIYTKHDASIGINWDVISYAIMEIIGNRGKIQK